MKIYANVSDSLSDIDTFTAQEFGTVENSISRIEKILSTYNVKYEFSYTIYDKIHGLLSPVFSRRGTIRDIVADMAGAQV